VFGKRAGEHAAEAAKDQKHGWIDEDRSETSMRWALHFM
jgi:hypothetical protein